jgi:tripartite-type tricarboxylate transporter receptor subunit TctC
MNPMVRGAMTANRRPALPRARIRAVARALLLAVCTIAPRVACADEFPSRSIRLLVGAPAGGTTDNMARTIAQPLSTSLGRPVLVENRPGAGGNLAAEAVARSAPDGYTLLVGFTSHTINATLYPSLPFDPIRDFTPISKIATVPSLLVSNPRVRAQDLKELIALAKARPGTLTIGVGAIGSSLHLAGEQLKLMAGIDLLNVPYKGTAPALTDVLGGQVDMMLISFVTGAAQVRAGLVRAYGVTSPHRQSAFPDLPAIGEIVPGFSSEAWFGIFGPARLPDGITGKLNAAVVVALEDPAMRDQLQREGANPAGGSTTEFAAFIREDIKRWAPIVRRSGARPD